MVLEGVTTALYVGVHYGTWGGLKSTPTWIFQVDRWYWLMSQYDGRMAQMPSLLRPLEEEATTECEARLVVLEQQEEEVLIVAQQFLSIPHSTEIYSDKSTRVSP